MRNLLNDSGAIAGMRTAAERRRCFLAGTLFITCLAPAQAPQSVEFRHLCTYGSKHGIHPPRILNRRTARAALGNADNPYGLVFPTAVTTDLHRRLWIADSGTASVHVFDRDSGAYREIKRVSETPLQRPSGIASDSQGRVYLTDAGSGGVYVFDEQGEYDHSLTKHSAARLESPSAIALSTDSKTIYVADPPRDVIVELNREGEVNGTIALPPEFGAPTAISIVDNQVYVLGGRQHRVGIFSPSGFFRGELRWDGVAAPTAFAFDPIRRRFVAANPRWMVVQLFNEDGGNLATFGQAGDGVDQMQRIDSLHVDAEGTVYIVDSLHGKVLAFVASQ